MIDTDSNVTDSYTKENHIVAFIDLLGFKYNVNEADKKILELLLEFAEMKSNKSSYNEIGTSDKNTKYCTYVPAISVFSDNIVISIQNNIGGDLINAVMILLNLIVKIAALALRKGFLIRGGVAKGSLYHQDGVVFGKALIDAYNLEQAVSIYPRVIVSQEVSQLYNDRWKDFFFKPDFDGLYMMDYIANVNPFIGKITTILLSPEDKSNPDKIKKSYNEYHNIILENIKKFENNPKVLCKWNWFLKYFKMEEPISNQGL